MADILTINSGSSSVKFSVYRMGNNHELLYSGAIDRIGLASGSFQIKDKSSKKIYEETSTMPDHDAAFAALFLWIKANTGLKRFDAVVHRVVHGGAEFMSPSKVTARMMERLRKLTPFAPEHLPHEIKGIEAVEKAYGGVFQAACFDTSFHTAMPTLARVFPLPDELTRQGVVRYGFHGLSYEYITAELDKRRFGKGRTIIAHLGNGCSMAAVKNGQPVDTTMGFTPAGGLMMSRRSGDLDPGILIYLMKEKGMNADGLNELINKKSGLLGVSGISTDMKDLLERERTDERAALAVNLFCYIARKHIAALASALHGLDMLVFTAGIGENSPEIRKRVCEGMEFLGIFLDEEKNRSGAETVSKHTSPVKIFVLHTDEELMMAKHAAFLTGLLKNSK